MAGISEILISAAAFIIFALGLSGFYLLFKSIFETYIFTGCPENSSTNREIWASSKSAVSDSRYFSLSKAGEDLFAPNFKVKFSSIFNNLYKKRKIYVLLSIFGIFSAVFFMVFKNIFTAVFIAIMSTAVINEFIKTISQKRKETMDIQLIEFISNMVIMLKAGKEMRQIFKESSEFMKEPLKTHIKNLVNQLELNISMDSALDNFAKSTESREANLLANAIKINRKTGGNLLFILENIIRTLQQNLKIKSKIKTQTAQSRFSGNFISLFPVAGFVAMYLFLKPAVSTFLSSKIGNFLFALGALFEFLGFIIINKILKEDYFN